MPTKILLIYNWPVITQAFLWIYYYNYFKSTSYISMQRNSIFVNKRIKYFMYNISTKGMELEDNTI